MNNKIINITILFLLVLFIAFRITTACGQMEQLAHESEHVPIEDLPITFTGILPCADCPGIDTYLILRDDQFTELSWYLDRDLAPFITEGTWILQNDTLSIFDENGERHKTFLYSRDQLTMLDRELQRITGDLADHYILERSPEDASIRQHYKKLKEEGVDFVASGNEPFWAVRIDFDDEMIYLTPEETLAFPLPDTETDGDVTTYHSETEETILTMIVERSYCRDSMSGFLFSHTVSLIVNGMEPVKGCGMDLIDL